MPRPPYIYIDKQLETSLAGPLLEVKYPEVKGIQPSCRLCEEALANVEEKVKHGDYMFMWKDVLSQKVRR